MTMKKGLFKKIGVLLIATAAVTAVAAMGLFNESECNMADKLYQKPKVLDDDIVLINIDQRALDDIGPYNTWGREIMAMALDELNGNGYSRPAVIGVDILYAGESGNPDADAWLAESAGAYDNVVVASAAEFGSTLITLEDSFFMDGYSVITFDEPFPALKENSTCGHINAMYDKDGILRHSILYIELPDGRKISSFGLEVYRKYAEVAGLSGIDKEPKTDDRYRWYLSYSALPGGFSGGYSITDLLNGDIDPSVYDGKIVLIGPYASGLSDYVLSAIDHASLMYGVEVQANVITALINKDFKTEVNNILQLISLFLVSFIALLFFRKLKIKWSTMVWLLISGGYLGVCVLAYKKGMVLRPLWIPLSVTIFYVASVAVNYVRATLEKRRITNTFKRYVAPEVVGEILKEDESSLGLGGKLTDIAVLFVDIRGFTTMSETLKPTQVVEILNKYLSLATDCIIANNGTLDKFIGDSAMAIWNSPLFQEDYIYKACKAAFDMVSASRELSKELEIEFGYTISFGIGVHCGPAVVGNIGTKMRMDFTAIGDTVNTAARLESNAPAGEIYISRAVADALKGRIIAVSLGDSIKLKGKSEGFEILRLNGFTENNTGGARE
ncbi:MAG: adenylate/guanylate cyclase domain-containing protein [Lachnospiraceae bacterium]|nr:adenylate/guanylate cyclase domain-containing protein [Lachnospiraceae bacterium]